MSKRTLRASARNTARAAGCTNKSEMMSKFKKWLKKYRYHLLLAWVWVDVVLMIAVVIAIASVFVKFYLTMEQPTNMEVITIIVAVSFINHGRR